MKTKITLLFLAFQLQSYAQINVLKSQFEQITKGKKAKVGVAILDFASKDSLTFNGNGHFPMQSVYKFHLALAVLNQIDKGKFTLNQKIFVSKADLRGDTHSPLRDKYPKGNVNLPLSEILSFTVSQSDNCGCDLLFKLLGGPSKVNDYIHSLGIKDVAIMTNEEVMQADWNVQYTNWSTPMAAATLLEKFHKKHILSKKSQDFLYKVLVETNTGVNKIKGLLPKNTITGHKTGWSGSNKDGLTGATNDIGIVTLPDGKQFAIAIFVTNSMEKEATNDRMIAEIAKATYDYFLEKTKKPLQK
jgi:beta-lactamase class A